MELLTFPPKDPSETLPLTFKLADELAGATIVGVPVITVAAVWGVDPNPNAIKSGVAQVSTTNVIHMVIGGLAGVDYELSFPYVTSDGRTLKAVGRLPVRTRK